MFGAILKATNSYFEKGITFCRSIYVKKVMKLLTYLVYNLIELKRVTYPAWICYASPVKGTQQGEMRKTTKLAIIAGFIFRTLHACLIAIRTKDCSLWYTIANTLALCFSLTKRCICKKIQSLTLYHTKPYIMSPMHLQSLNCYI